MAAVQLAQRLPGSAFAAVELSTGKWAVCFATYKLVRMPIDKTRTGYQAELLCPELPNVPSQASDKQLSLESRIMSANDHAQVTNAKQLTEKLKESGKLLVPILEGNLVDKVWGADRPAPPKAPLRIHKMEHAGQSVQDKLIKLRKDMQGRLACWVSFTHQ